MRRLGAQNTESGRTGQLNVQIRKSKSHGDERTIKTAMAVSLVIVLSKLVGLARVVVFADVFGQNLQTDAYNASYKLLSVIYIGFTAAISVAFIPIYTKIRLNTNERQANLYASNILNFFMVCGLLLSAVCYFFAPQISPLMYQGPPDGLATTAMLTQIMFPTIFFWSIQGTMTDLLDARRVFIPEQLVGFAYSICIIVACLFFKDIKSIAWATSVSAVLQVIIVLPFMRKNFKYRARLNLKDKNLKQTFLIAVPALVSTGFDEINTWTDTLFASKLVTGAVTALNNSFSIAQMIIGVLITPITTIMFTELSNFAALGQIDKLKDTVRKSLEVVALLTFPIIVLSVVCSTDIIGVIYQHGAYTAEDTLLTAPVFAFYIIGIFGFGMRTFMTRVFFALQMAKIPMLVGMFSVSLNIALDLILMGPMGPRGLTLATTIASFVASMMMLGLLRKKIGKMKMGKSLGQFAKIFVATAVCLAIAYVVHGLIPSSDTSFTANLTRFIESFGAGLIVFCLMAMLLRIDMFGRVMRMFTRRFVRRRTV
ncbi:MAG: murein biosynthesis integral membrane protein MurJ [Eubacteriales bacterium]